MLNAVPVIDSLLLSTASPRTNDVLTAQVAATDADADPISLQYLWTVNGVTVRDVTTTNTTDSLDLSQASNGDLGDAIQLTVTPNDGIDSGQAVWAYASVAASPLVEETDAALLGFAGDPLTAAVVARFLTPDAGVYAASIDWGDGLTSSGTVVEDGGGHYRILGDHTYAQWGLYVVMASLSRGTDQAATLYNNADFRAHQYTDPLGNQTQFFYNANWQLTQEVDVLGNSTYYTYNADGSLASRIDRLGREIDLAYDDAGRLTSETWWTANGGSVADTLAFTYSTAGELQTASNAWGTYSFSWNSGQLMSVTNPFNVSLSFGYDTEGHRANITDSFGGATTSTYSAGSLASRTFTDGASRNLRVELGYDAGGWLTGISRYSDFAATQLVAMTQYGYANSALASITHRDAASNIIDFFDYTFNADFQLTSIDSQSIGDTDYGYDADGQIISETSQVTTDTYAYDANGNRNGAGYVIGPGNRLMSDGVSNYSYDAEGNLTKKVHASAGVAWKYSYDHRNHMVEARQFSEDPDYYGTAVLQLDADYKYDALGNRIEKSVDPDGAGPLAAVDTRYVFDGFNGDKPMPVGTENWDVVMELDGNNALTTRYLDGDDVDQVFGRIDPSPSLSASEGIQWYFTDHLNSVRAVINNAGAVLDRIAYDAFGNVTMQVNPALGNHILFTSRQFDAETGSYLNRARYFNPDSGTWTTQDPIGFWARDANLYRYVFNSPTNFTDPSGLSIRGRLGGIVGGAVFWGAVGAVAGGLVGPLFGVPPQVGVLGGAGIGIIGGGIYGGIVAAERKTFWVGFWEPIPFMANPPEPAPPFPAAGAPVPETVPNIHGWRPVWLFSTPPSRATQAELHQFDPANGPTPLPAQALVIGGGGLPVGLMGLGLSGISQGQKFFPAPLPPGQFAGVGGCQTSIGVIVTSPSGTALFHFSRAGDVEATISKYTWPPNSHAAICGGTDAEDSPLTLATVISALEAEGIAIDGIRKNLLPAVAAGVLGAANTGNIWIGSDGKWYFDSTLGH